MSVRPALWAVTCRVLRRYTGHLSRTWSLVAPVRQVTALKCDVSVGFGQKCEKIFWCDNLRTENCVCSLSILIKHHHFFISIQVGHHWVQLFYLGQHGSWVTFWPISGGNDTFFWVNLRPVHFWPISGGNDNSRRAPVQDNVARFRHCNVVNVVKTIQNGQTANVFGCFGHKTCHFLQIEGTD